MYKSFYTDKKIIVKQTHVADKLSNSVYSRNELILRLDFVKYGCMCQIALVYKNPIIGLNESAGLKYSFLYNQYWSNLVFVIPPIGGNSVTCEADNFQ